MDAGSDSQPIDRARLFEQAEIVLACAHERLVQTRLAEAREALQACRAYVGLYAAPHYIVYNPATLVKDHADALSTGSCTLDVDPMPECAGAPEQVWDCLRQLVRNAALEPDSTLAVEVFEENGVPCVALSFDGPGRFPPDMLVDGFLPITLDELAQRWTWATRNGRFDRAPNGLLLRLAGQRLPPEPVAGLEPLAAALDEVLHALDGPPESAGQALGPCLALVRDGEGRKEPVGLKSLITEVLNEIEQSLTEHGITTDIMVGPDLPPLLMNRRIARAFFANVLRYTMAILPNGGVLAMMSEYDQPKRAASILITIHGPHCHVAETFHLASLRRAIVEVHEGSFEWTPEANGVALVVTAPDAVGRALDAWIPGFEAFSDRSKQLLRLLKSGAETPPEDFLLGGILEHELEQWLLPKLASPATLNIAHDLAEENRGLPGSSPPRLQKALAQIRRGKPRKEIAAPPYAAELLWAFRRSPRHRSALGIAPLDDAAVVQLCTGLLKTPPDYVDCLRIIAQAIAPT